jgi:ribosomal protein L11 methylase PrmA
MIMAGGLFVIKMAYVFCTAMVLSTTQGALFVSTSRVRIRAFIKAVPMKAGQMIVDLGCGDGRILRLAQKHYNVRAIGYEVNLMAYLKARVLSFGINDIEIRRRDFWSANLSDADVVFCYLYPDVLKKLSAKLKATLKPGAVIVSCNFILPGFKPSNVLHPAGARHSDPVYIYRVG